MVSLYKDPDGDNVFVAHEEVMTCTLETTLHSERQDGQDMDALRQRINYLEDQLAKHNPVCHQVGFEIESDNNNNMGHFSIG